MKRAEECNRIELLGQRGKNDYNQFLSIEILLRYYVSKPIRFSKNTDKQGLNKDFFHFQSLKTIYSITTKL